MIAAIKQQIAIDPKVLGGNPHILGRRISVAHVAIWHEQMGKTVGEIAYEYDLSLSEIYAALTYYHQNRAEVDESIKADDEYADAMKRLSTSKIKALANGQ